MRLPILDRQGEPRAHFIVDDADAHWVAQWRWSFAAKGYVSRMSRKCEGPLRRIYLHRALLGLCHGDPRQGEHINRDKLDNRRANLVIATPLQNSQNKPSLGGVSAYRGVSWHKGAQRWRADVQIARRQHSLGYFDTESAAAEAASAYRAAHMPFSEDARGVQP